MAIDVKTVAHGAVLFGAMAEPENRRFVATVLGGLTEDPKWTTSTHHPPGVGVAVRLA